MLDFPLPDTFPDWSMSIEIWSYGSNGMAQLRARCGNPHLMSRPAYAKGFARVFCLRGPEWRGGVASIAPCAGAVTYGSLVTLSREEKGRLDAYEGGYREEILEVWEVVGDATLKRRALTYVAGHGDKWTPAMTTRPSEAYLTAISLHLRECEWNHEDIHVKSSSDPEQVLEVWRHPGVDGLETLEAVAIEVNAVKSGKWTMPRASIKFADDCRALGIHTVPDLANALSPAEESPPDVSGWTGPLLRGLRARDPNFWDDDTLAALRQLPLQRVFVYGTLQRGLSNHHQLEDSRLVHGFVRTQATDIALVEAPGGGQYPYAIKADDARPDSQRGPLLGELFAVSTDLLESNLDDLEGHPFFYARSRIPIVLRDSDEPSSQTTRDLGLAWAYFLVNEDALLDMSVSRPHAYPDVVPTGDFRSFWRHRYDKYPRHVPPVELN